MTILFRDDWLKYPGAMIDYDTPNESFLRIAEIYDQMNIVNCAFPLSILDRDLIGVDPFDIANLTDVMKLKILTECQRNYWYYIREIAKVDGASGLDGISFKANRSNMASYWLYHNHITFINTIIRQTGKTTTIKAIYGWLLNFGISGAHIGLVTKDAGLKAETMSNIKDLFDYLPEYLRVNSKRDVMNGEILNVKANDNTLHAWVSNISPKLAYKVARGFPIGTLCWDEIAFIENIAIAMSSASYSGNNAKEELLKLGLPHGTMMFTTAGDLDNVNGRFVYDIISSSTLFTETFFDCKDRKELEEVIYTNSLARTNREKKAVVTISLSYKQLGYSEEWMKKRLIENGLSTDASIERDLFNVWVSGSSQSPLSEADNKRIREHEQEEVWRELYKPYNYLLRWYLKPEEIQLRIGNNHSFIIGVDTSDGIGRDDLSFVVRDSVTGEIVCVAVFNELNLITLSEFFVSFMMKYLNSVMVIERKSSAATIIDNMILLFAKQGVNPFKRMYNTIFQEKEKYPKEFDLLSRSRGHDLDLYNEYRKHIGFVTTGSTRNMLYSTVLLMMVKYTAHLLRDKLLVGQILGLIYKNGRVDHPQGGHDDIVIGALLNFFLLILGKNLYLYGIQSNQILKKNDVYIEGKYEATTSAFEREDMERIELQINELLDKAKQTNNSIILNQIERRIRFLCKDYNIDTSTLTLEDLYEKMKNKNNYI